MTNKTKRTKYTVTVPTGQVMGFTTLKAAQRYTFRERAERSGGDVNVNSLPIVRKA